MSMCDEICVYVDPRATRAARQRGLDGCTTLRSFERYEDAEKNCVVLSFSRSYRYMSCTTILIIRFRSAEPREAGRSRCHEVCSARETR